MRERACVCDYVLILLLFIILFWVGVGVPKRKQPELDTVLTN